VKKWLALLLVLVCEHTSYAVTLVYNLRVRRVFTIAAVLERMKKRVLVSAVPIFFTRKRLLSDELTNLTGCEKRRAGGSLINMRYIHSKHWWLEATTGIETDHGTFTGSDPFKASRTGFDDVVLATGYRHFIGKKMQLVGYGLAGIPTRRKVTLEDRRTPLVGTRFFNLGIGGEVSYSFLSNLRHSFAAIFQTRFIHGFNRSWFPILPKNARIQPGNATDILLTAQFREQRTIFEAGYNATIFSNQAVILPTQTITTDTFVRHGGYVNVSHAILKAFFDKPFIFGAGCNINHTNFNDARAFTGWIHFSIVF
jgi:hypothetical protein